MDVTNKAKLKTENDDHPALPPATHHFKAQHAIAITNTAATQLYRMLYHCELPYNPVNKRMRLFRKQQGYNYAPNIGVRLLVRVN